MGINMGVYIGLVCLLLACQGVVSRDSQNSFEFNSDGKSIQFNSIQIDQRKAKTEAALSGLSEFLTSAHHQGAVQLRRSSRRSIEMADAIQFNAIQPNATDLSADPMTVTPLVTKELVYTCEVVNTTTTYFKTISSISIMGLEKIGNETEERKLATIDAWGPATYPPYEDETIAAEIKRHPADHKMWQTSATGYLRLSISYPTLKQIYSLSPYKRTVCKVIGEVEKDGTVVAGLDNENVTVDIVKPTFQSLGGSFDIEPKNIKPLLSENLAVACHFNGIEAVKTVKKIEIKKDGVCVAACDAAGHCVSTNPTYFPGANVTGWMDGASGNLIATVNYPKEVHSGSYECFIDLANQEDRSLDATSDAVDVNATDPTLKDLIDWTIDNKQEADEEIENLKAINIEQSKKIKEADGDREKMTKRISTAETDIKGLKSNTSIMENEIKELKSKMKTAVAFSAVMYGTSWSKVDNGNILKFNTASVNIGDGYSTSTGKFTCPVEGTYYISYNLQTLPNEWDANAKTNTAVYLVKNNHVATWGSKHANPENNAWGTIGAGLVLELKKGDKLWIQAERTSYFYWEHSNHSYASMFTGILVK